MAAYILTWNPDRWDWPPSDFEAAVQTTAAGRPYADQWSTGSRRYAIGPGDRGYLLRQHRDRGLVASGTFTSSIFEAPHFDNSGRLASYAAIEFDTVLPIADRLDISDLIRRVNGVAWQWMQGSGVSVPPAEAATLESVWARHLGDIPWRAPEELASEGYEEGALVRIEVNRYERDRAARRACIAHHGTTCTVCGFSYEERYGPIGRDFVHVHHLREISTLGPGYLVDPVKDLVPLCANCHSMVHRTRPALTPQQLRKRLRTL